MAEGSIQIGVKGLLETIDAFKRRAGGVRSGTQTALRNALTDVQRDVWAGFDESRQVGGKSWKPLAPSTLAWKLRHRYSSKPNIRTGALRNFWSMEVSGTRGVLRSSATGKKGVKYGVYVNEVRPIVPTVDRVREVAVKAFRRMIDVVLK